MSIELIFPEEYDYDSLPQEEQEEQDKEVQKAYETDLRNRFEAMRNSLGQ